MNENTCSLFIHELMGKHFRIKLSSKHIFIRHTYIQINIHPTVEPYCETCGQIIWNENIFRTHIHTSYVIESRNECFKCDK